MASNHRQHRPHRLSLPPRTATPTTAPITPSRHYPPFTPTPTPSKHRLPPPSSATTKSTRFSTSSLFLLLFSLRSLYSLLPFLQSSPSSFAVFPFSFLVSLLSFLLSLSFSLFFSKRSPNPNPNPNPSSKSKSIFAFHHSITRLQQRILFAKSILLAIVFLLRFQALRYCGTAAMIMAETSGHVASNFVFASGRNRTLIHLDRVNSNKVRGFFSLFIGIFLLSISWDRIECFPFSFVNLEKLGFWNVLIPNSEKCVRVWPMLLPFLSGFLGGYEQLTVNWGSIRDLGRKEVRLISLFYTTILLFIPAAISMLVFEAEGDSVSIGGLGWPLANTVVFGVLLSESYTDEKKPVASKDFRREFMVTFVCTVVLELLYYPELSLWGLLICGMLLGIGVMELDPVRSSSLELGMETPDSFLVSVTKVVRHIVSERKSRKIALFLLINTGYMVVEFVAGFMNNSLGLISDACHMLFDCAALGIGLYASYIARLPANGRYNYGRGRFEVLSGYTNAVFLVLVGALIVLESLERILEPQEISTSSLLTVSIGGLAVNVVGLIFFHDEHHHAHGGGLSCSHSHSRSHSHLNVGVGHEIGGKHQEDHHYSHVHGGGDHEIGGKQQEDHRHSHVYGGGGHEIGGKHQEDHRHSHVYGGGDHEIGGKHQEDHRHSHVHGGGGHEIGNKHQDHEHKSDRHRSHASEGNVSSTSHCHDHDHDHHDHDHHHHQGHHGHHHDHVLTSSTGVPGEDNQKHYDHDHDHNHDHDHGHHHDHHDHGHHHNHHDHGHHHDHDRHDHGHHHHHDHHHHDHVPMEDKQNHHHHHHHIDHNMEGIFLHVLADTLGSVGVVVSTLLIQYKGWLIADPACSIFISLLIVSSVIPLLRNSAEVLLQRVPRAHEHDLKAAVTSIMKIKGISGIHNFHVWSLANNDTVGTLHLYVSSETDKISAKKRVSEILRDAGVKDLTLQVEICR